MSGCWSMSCGTGSRRRRSCNGGDQSCGAGRDGGRRAVCGVTTVDGGDVGAGSARTRGGAGADQGGGFVPFGSVGDQRQPAAADADGAGPRGGRHRRGGRAGRGGRRSDLAPGDHVVFVFVPSCGHCEPCTVGRPALCEPGAAANGAGTLLSGARRLHRPDGTRSTITSASRRSPTTPPCLGTPWSRSTRTCR